MKSIKFTDKEITELKSFYRCEQKNIAERLEIIKGILSKVDIDEKQSVEKPGRPGLSEASVIDRAERNGEETQATADKPEKKESQKPRKRRKKARKSKWGSFILDLLKQQGRPIKFEHIVEEAIYKFEAPKEKHKNVKQSLTNSAFKLRKHQKKIHTLSIPGVRGKYVGLSRWFDKDGELKENYKVKLPALQTEKPKTRKMEPAKTTTDQSPDRPTWPEFVLKSLEKEGKPIHAKVLTEKAMHEFNIDEKLYEKTRIAVARTMSSLDKQRSQLKTYSQAGVVGKFYGLAGWFDNNGKLEEKYLTKLKSSADAISA